MSIDSSPRYQMGRLLGVCASDVKRKKLFHILKINQILHLTLFFTHCLPLFTLNLQSRILHFITKLPIIEPKSPINTN